MIFAIFLKRPRPLLKIICERLRTFIIITTQAYIIFMTTTFGNSKAISDDNNTNKSNLISNSSTRTMSNEKPKSYRKLYAELGEQRKQQFPKDLNRQPVKVDRYNCSFTYYIYEISCDCNPLLLILSQLHV